LSNGGSWLPFIPWEGTINTRWKLYGPASHPEYLGYETIQTRLPGIWTFEDFQFYFTFPFCGKGPDRLREAVNFTQVHQPEDTRKLKTYMHWEKIVYMYKNVIMYDK